MHNFEYAEPRYESEVVGLLSPEPGRSAVLAGGTDLMPLLKKMIATPDRVVNIMEVAGLKQIELMAEGWVKIGAAVTLDRLLDSEYLREYPAVLQAVRGINSMQLQCQGTIGGDLCQRPQCWFFRNGRGLLAEAGRLVAQGDNRFHAIFGNSGPAKFVSASRLAPALVAMGARMRIVGPDPREEAFIAAEQFFRTPQHDRDGETVLRPNQLLAHIYLPPARGLTNAAYEVHQGAGPDDPLATAAVALEIVGGVVQQARVVLGQVAPTPWISTEASAAIVGREITEETAEAAGRAAVVAATPLSNNGYKVQLAKVAVKRALLQAAGREMGGH